MAANGAAARNRLVDDQQRIDLGFAPDAPTVELIDEL
jgi:hypothetical protein